MRQVLVANDRGAMDDVAETSRMDLDDVRRALAVLEQCTVQRPAGITEAPQDVAVGAGQEVRRKEGGLARREPIQCVLLAAPRQPVRTVAPTQQPLWDDTDFVATGDETQDEVIVFSPSTVAVAELRKHLATYHQRRMHDGAFDVGLFAHTADRVDAVQPTFVGAQSVTQWRAGKESHVAADRHEPGFRVEPVQLRCQSMPMHEVVGVHACNDVGAAVSDPRVQCRDQAAMRRRNDGEARVARRESPRTDEHIVLGAVIDDDAFPARLALA